MSTAARTHDRETFNALVDALHVHPVNAATPTGVAATTTFDSQVKASPAFAAEAHDVLAELDQLAGGSFASLSPSDAASRIRNAAFAGETPADPGFDSFDDLRPYLERLTAEIQKNAAASPSNWGKQQRPPDVFGAQPYPPPDPSYDPTKVKLSDEDRRLQSTAFAAVSLANATCASPDPRDSFAF